MSYYNDASLVLLAQDLGKKAGSVAAQKPMDANGQMTFTRTGDTATRVAPNGLIEKVRTNLILQSNTFSNASWTKSGVGVGSVSVVTPNYTTDPFGGNNAWRFQCNLNGGTTSSDRSWMLQSFTPIANSILSIYIKLNVAGSKTIILSNGGGDVQTITSTDWVRINFVISASNGEFRIGLVGGYTSDTLDCSIAFAQAETGDVATAYIPTTTAAVSVGPVANVPRLDYLGSTCGKLLLEPQRTNNALYSEQFSNAAWSKNQSTISSNSAISPDGYMSADKLIEDSSNAVHDINQLPFSTTGGQTYTFSIFVKPDTRSKIRIGYGALVNFDAFGGDVSAIIDVSNKTVISSVLSPTVLFSDFENGYVRVTFLKQATGSGQFNLIFGLVNNSNADSYLGDGSSGLFIWGAQMEAGAYATSYIPTLGAAVTRGADAASKTGISSLIGQTEGTLFVDLHISKILENEALININSGGYSDNITMQRLGASVQFVRNSATQSGPSIVLTPISVGINKLAVAYKNGDTAFYLNGIQVSATQTQTFTNNTLTTIRLGVDAAGSLPVAERYNQALLFKTRLSNAQLAELTAL